MNPMVAGSARCPGATDKPRAAARPARLFFPKKLPLKYLILALALSTSPEATATNRWFDCVSGSVQTASCWSGNVKPGTTDAAFIGHSSFTNNVTAALASGSFTPQYEYIGYSGFNGTVNHSGGTNGSPTATYLISIGEGAGRTGTYNLSGTGVVNAGNTMYVGAYGTGIFNQTGGSNIVPTTLYIGAWTGSNGSYTLQSGTLNVSNPLVFSQEFIGYRGAGSFTQSGGTHTANSLSMAVLAGSTGVYHLSSGNLNLGSLSLTGAGAATFNHSGGTNQVAGNVFLSAYGAGSAVYNLSGTGGLTVGSLFVGGEGTNAFTQTGGTHVVNGNLVMGAGTASSSGTYHLRGGTLTVGISVMQNLMGTGTLNIDGGTLTVGGGNGSIDVDNLVLGSLAGYTGSHTLAGSGTVTVGNVSIGQGGAGIFMQTGGTHTVSNNLTIAALPGSSGIYDLQGGGLSAAAVINRGTLNFSGGALNAPVIINTGNLNLSGAGTRALAGAVTNNGTVHVAGGTTAQFDGYFSGAGGITGTGTSVFNGGLAPGNSPANVNVVGNVVFGSGNVFAVEIGGLTAGTQYDRLTVGGSASLDGTLDVSLIDLGSGLFAPQAGDTFDILNAEILSGSFSALSFAALLDPNLSWQIDYLTDAIGTTDVVRLSVVSAVPVPPAVWLFGSGLIGLIGLARRKKK